MHEIRKVAVIGSGVMGAGIAAQIANGGVSVLLLDIVPPAPPARGEGAPPARGETAPPARGETAPPARGEDAPPARGESDASVVGDRQARNAVAAGALERLRKTEPAPFMSARAAKRVTIGNIEDDLAELADCDWIIEVIVERLDVKQALYRKIDAVRRPGTPVSSNTSTIPLAHLVEGMPEAFARDFLITHFFNPPRYMRLLEIVAGAHSDPALVAAVSRFGDVVLGKSIVVCKDSPGFIANRLGVYWLQLGVIEAMDGGLTIEEADAVMGRPLGIPKTGVFGLIDLVGLDLMPHIAASLGRTLPKDDPFHASVRDAPLIGRMIADGYIGRKGKGGFYRIDRSGGRKDKQSIDLATGAYRAPRTPDLPELAGAEKDIRRLLAADTRAGRYAWRVIGRVLAYAARLVPEAADGITAIDEAMRLGYNWKWGPFELIDKVGAAWLIERLTSEGIAIPPLLAQAADTPFYRTIEGKRQTLERDGTYRDIVRPDGVLLLEDIKLVSQPVLKGSSAALWDIGDGVACFEFTGKGNSIDQAAMTLLEKAIGTVKARFKALVIYNEGTHFSVGANLGLALFAANMAAWSEIERLIESGQRIYKGLKYAPFPVVAAPAGMALGGGCEILLHSDAVQAHAETYAGLVECGVGLIPGWGGCKEMLMRWAADASLPHGPMPAPVKVFETVSTATVSKSAAEAQDMKILRADDGITMNRTRLLADAKAKALALAETYVVPSKPEPIGLPGPAGKLGMDLAAAAFAKRGIATPHDVTVAGALAEVLSGGDADCLDRLGEDDILKLERRAFMRLIKTPGTLARIEHTLETGKPLRN